MMSSSTWTRPRTSLVLALAIVTAAACIKTSHAQDLYQGIEQIAGPLAQIWPEYKTDIEQQTEKFKETTLDQIRAWVDMITFNEMAETLARILPALRSDIEEQTKNGNGTTQEKIKALVDMIICKKSVICGKNKVAMDLVPRRRQDNTESILIIENSQKEDDISHWKMSLNDVIRRWDDHASDCYNINKECSDDNPAMIANGESCYFNTQWLGPHCGDDGNWGYVDKSPCIIVEMNKIAGWTPDVYRSTDELPPDMPEVIKTHIKQQTNFTYEGKYGREFSEILWLNCKGQTMADDENIGEIEYTPWQGFPKVYFPYVPWLDCWTAPLVAVRFINPTKNVLINVECKVYAKDISYSRYDSPDSVYDGYDSPDSVYGVMNFELLID